MYSSIVLSESDRTPDLVDVVGAIVVACVVILAPVVFVIVISLYVDTREWPQVRR